MRITPERTYAELHVASALRAVHCSESSCETVDIWGVTGPRIITAEFLFGTFFFSCRSA